MTMDAISVLQEVSSKYRNTLETIPSEGLKNTLVRSVYERVLVLLNVSIKNLYQKTLCLAKASEKCVKTGGMEYCTTQCGNIGFVNGSNGEEFFVINKFGSNSSAVKITENEISILNKNTGVIIGRDSTIKLVLPSKDEKNIIEIDLSDPDNVFEKLEIIKYAFRKSEEIVRKTLEAELFCIKQRMLAC